MIVLTFAFCLIATGQCHSMRVPEMYPTSQACQLDGEKQAAAMALYMSDQWHKPPTITCAVDPKDQAS